MIVVDGLQWTVPCTIKRIAEVKSSEISGMLLNKQYFVDVIGTYLRYSVTMVVPKGMEGDYAQIYEILSDPKAFHEFTLPYNQSQVNITARVETISDYYVRQSNNKHTWRHTTFEIIANHPTKTVTLGEVVSTGMAATPQGINAEVGDIYEYTSSGWSARYYENADEVYY